MWLNNYSFFLFFSLKRLIIAQSSSSFVPRADPKASGGEVTARADQQQHRAAQDSPGSRVPPAAARLQDGEGRRPGDDRVLPQETAVRPSRLCQVRQGGRAIPVRWASRDALGAAAAFLGEKATRGGRVFPRQAKKLGQERPLEALVDRLDLGSNFNSPFVKAYTLLCQRTFALLLFCWKNVIDIQVLMCGVNGAIPIGSAYTWIAFSPSNGVFVDFLLWRSNRHTCWTCFRYTCVF